MKKCKLNYQFHDPNPAAATADYILSIFIEANQDKVRQAIQTAADMKNGACKERSEGCPA